MGEDPHRSRRRSRSRSGEANDLHREVLEFAPTEFRWVDVENPGEFAMTSYWIIGNGDWGESDMDATGALHALIRTGLDHDQDYTESSYLVFGLMQICMELSSVLPAERIIPEFSIFEAFLCRLWPQHHWGTFYPGVRSRARWESVMRWPVDQSDNAPVCVPKDDWNEILDMFDPDRQRRKV